MLRTEFRVARLSADQRAIQKKDEHRFSIFFKEQLHKEEPQVNPNEVGDVWAIVWAIVHEVLRGLPLS